MTDAATVDTGVESIAAPTSQMPDTSLNGAQPAKPAAASSPSASMAESVQASMAKMTLLQRSPSAVSLAGGQTEELSSPGPTASERPASDSTMAEAVRSARERQFIQDLEVKMREKAQEESTQSWSLPLMNSYQRALTLRVAQHLSLDAQVDAQTKAITLTKAESWKIADMPTSALASLLAPPSESASASSSGVSTPPFPLGGFKIMRREQANSGHLSPRNSDSNGDGQGGPSGGEGSGSGTGTPAGGFKKDRRLMTMEEREAEYRKARERIFGKEEAGESSSGAGAQELQDGAGVETEGARPRPRDGSNPRRYRSSETGSMSGPGASIVRPSSRASSSFSRDASSASLTSASASGVDSDNSSLVDPDFVMDRRSTSVIYPPYAAGMPHNGRSGTPRSMPPSVASFDPSRVGYEQGQPVYMQQPPYPGWWGGAPGGSNGESADATYVAGPVQGRPAQVPIPAYGFPAGWAAAGYAPHLSPGMLGRGAAPSPGSRSTSSAMSSNGDAEFGPPPSSSSTSRRSNSSSPVHQRGSAGDMRGTATPPPGPPGQAPNGALHWTYGQAAGPMQPPGVDPQAIHFAWPPGQQQPQEQRRSGSGSASPGGPFGVPAGAGQWMGSPHGPPGYVYAAPNGAGAPTPPHFGAWQQPPNQQQQQHYQQHQYVPPSPLIPPNPNEAIHLNGRYVASGQLYAPRPAREKKLYDPKAPSSTSPAGMTGRRSNGNGPISRTATPDGTTVAASNAEHLTPLARHTMARHSRPASPSSVHAVMGQMKGQQTPPASRPPKPKQISARAGLPARPDWVLAASRGSTHASSPSSGPIPLAPGETAPAEAAPPCDSPAQAPGAADAGVADGDVATPAEA